MKKIIFLLLLTFIILQPIRLSAALSLEALELVEQLRRNLNKDAARIDEASVDSQAAVGNEYIVGRELKNALQRLRQKVYGGQPKRAMKKTEPTPMVVRSEIMKQTVDEENVPELYVPGIELREAISRVRATRDPSEISNEVAAASPGIETEAKNDDNSWSQSLNNETESPIEVKAKKKYESLAAKTPGFRLKSSLATGDKDSDSEAGEPDSVKEENLDQELEKLQDRVLNNEISKHEFKMPQNYRIIVR